MSDQDELAAAVARVKALPAFAIPRWWLTFYLVGAPVDLASVASRLREVGAQNTDNPDCGFLYPKLLVVSELRAISDAISSVRRVANTEGVKLEGLDADTSPEVGASEFKRLLDF